MAVIEGKTYVTCGCAGTGRVNSGVVAKYNQNIDVYPDGFVTTDQSWINFLTNQYGLGIQTFGAMLASHPWFSQCMAQRAYQEVCLKKLALSDSVIKEISESFEKEKFQFKSLFKTVVKHETCFQ